MQRPALADNECAVAFTVSVLVSCIFYAVIWFAAVPIAQHAANPQLVPMMRVMGLSLLIPIFHLIPDAMLERVFEPFFRLESSRNADTGGTGLGLSIARDIAQAHGGSLVLRNRMPRGLEAILRLPTTLSR